MHNFFSSGVRFLFFGSITAIFCLLIGHMLFEYNLFFRSQELINLVSGSIGIILNFILNYKFNFQYGKKNFMAEFKRFSIVALFSVFINVPLTFINLLIFEKYLTMFYVSINEIRNLIHALVLIQISILNFIMHYFYSFKNRLKD